MFSGVLHSLKLTCLISNGVGLFYLLKPTTAAPALGVGSLGNAHDASNIVSSARLSKVPSFALDNLENSRDALAIGSSAQVSESTLGASKLCKRTLSPPPGCRIRTPPATPLRDSSEPQSSSGQAEVSGIPKKKSTTGKITSWLKNPKKLFNKDKDKLNQRLLDEQERETQWTIADREQQQKMARIEQLQQQQEAASVAAAIRKDEEEKLAQARDIFQTDEDARKALEKPLLPKLTREDTSSHISPEDQIKKDQDMKTQLERQAEDRAASEKDFQMKKKEEARLAREKAHQLAVKLQEQAEEVAKVETFRLCAYITLRSVSLEIFSSQGVHKYTDFVFRVC